MGNEGPSGFITDERRRSSVTGTGIQYIPGHTEGFIDLTLERFLPADGEILDLGGGGLRFALPAAARGRSVTVVDLDPAAMNLAEIVPRVTRDPLSPDAAALGRLLSCEVSDILDFLRKTTKLFHLITAFRVVHFFEPSALDEFFQRACGRLAPGGVLAVSGMTPFDLEKDGYNALYLESEALGPENPLYRRFRQTGSSVRFRSEQNLPEKLHWIDSGLIRAQAERNHVEIVVSDYRATRIVQGFVLRRP